MLSRLLLVTAGIITAVPAFAQHRDLNVRLPVDPAVTMGVFDNGLRYYIRANSRPENRAELRLVVNAGSVLEDDDQCQCHLFVRRPHAPVGAGEE